jgi:cyclophilin family peptidyl-prolyl cis-trans isomerase
MGDRCDQRAIAVTACVLIAVGAMALGCGGAEDSSTRSENATARDSSTVGNGSAVHHNSAAEAAAECEKARPPKVRPADYRAPAWTVKKGERLTAVVKTNCGAFSIALNSKWSLTAVNSFVFLAEKGFYDGLRFERVAYDSYVEGGKPPGAHGPGYSVKGEIPESFIYRHGVVAMLQPPEAPAGHSGSRFFIVVASPWLDFSEIYAPFGKVNRGMKVVKRISELGPPRPTIHNVGTNGPIGKVKQPVVIKTITIDRA